MTCANATPWGYTVDGALPPLLGVAEFHRLVPNISSSDARIEDMLDGISQALRDWCGWHIGPALDCVYTGDGEGRLLMLPAMGVTAVSSLKIDGETVDPGYYEWTSAGMVRLKHGRFPDSWRSVECAYTAGFPLGAVAQVAAQVASNALVAAPGVREEHAGAVGISYNETGSGITGGVSMLERDLSLLAPYRLVRAW